MSSGDESIPSYDSPGPGSGSEGEWEHVGEQMEATSGSDTGADSDWVPKPSGNANGNIISMVGNSIILSGIYMISFVFTVGYWLATDPGLPWTAATVALCGFGYTLPGTLPLKIFAAISLLLIYGQRFVTLDDDVDSI